MRPPEPRDSATTGSQGRINHISSADREEEETSRYGYPAGLPWNAAAQRLLQHRRHDSLYGPAFCFWTNASRYLEQAPPCRGIVYLVVSAFQWAVFPLSSGAVDGAAPTGRQQ
ncbi:hypothetical protein CSOJ01_04228 [Colletotrichum sojae]|uniref:Uncharacterized protein n=1 Tax=Colletotrichum sojae TaxID=2175907 RepID=A0A8H6MYW8_9PEZI|nr:hypothetical protein CSOJ01_04228 [Colletotrichum sojae]